MWETTDVAGPADLGGSYSGPRWSYHNARPPAWLQNQDPRVIQWFHDNIYDVPTVAPEATLTSIENQMMAESARLGVRLDATTSNVVLAYAKLQLGLLDWRSLANEAGSATPSGPNALQAPLLDVINQREAAAIQAVAGQLDPNNYNGDDAAILATLYGAGASFSQGLAQPLALSPVPAPQERQAQALSQGSPAVMSPYSGLSSFEGFGPGGNFATMPLQAPRSGFSISPLMLLAIAGVAAYLLTRKS